MGWIISPLCLDKFQSTLLMRGATCNPIWIIICYTISIHAPHARSDRPSRQSVDDTYDFNPRSSCEERRAITLHPMPSSRISIHAPHARSDCTVIPLGFVWVFQSTLLMRGATESSATNATTGLFQSTLLMRGATCLCFHAISSSCISIHAPHARSDPMYCVHQCQMGQTFQSTLLMRGATFRCVVNEITMRISIHAPHARSDLFLPTIR